MIKACIFDLDGTLAYTLDSMAAVGNQVVRKFGLNPMPVENYRYYCGNGADMLVKRLLIDAGDKSLYIMKKHVSFTERNLIRILSIKYSITRECRRL